jgi:class 3 adenylate cyclase/tetratricopeptide (TPR) repeat protein
MKCLECQYDNPDDAVFCCKCGTKFETLCHGCGYQNPSESSFCCKCGISLSAADSHEFYQGVANPANQPLAIAGTDINVCEASDSERKCVTVMFSDMTGYTEMSEKLDPEEVKEITGAIFCELTKIIEKYDGFIEKYIGDAILAVFGAKEAFEDSALRAIKAAREIHTYVDSASPKYEEVIGHKLSMHTGINTGLVVTGEINYQKGTHGLVGDTINTAARLMSVSQPGEIITDHESYVQTKGYFEFETLKPVRVKGKAKPVKVYLVAEALQTPRKLHRLHGLRAELIGRSIEMQVLKDAAESLEQGKGSVVSVCGTAGTGKSRLVHEFKNSLDLGKYSWFDGNAYPYTQNMPYYPLVDLLTKAFGIKEGDSYKAIRQKVESNLEELLGKGTGKIPYIGGLFSIEYSETKDVGPEYWKDQLFSAVADVLRSLSLSGPTIVCLEDMHWADPSTTEMVRNFVSNLSYPLMLVCIYRPTVIVFTDFETKALKTEFSELRLRELSPSESHEMVCSLLKTDEIPKELRSFVRESIDGNPFFVEELINALIDSGALSRNSGQWVLSKAIDESFISTNVHGVISGRIDRLGRDTKRILQEASVIGRAFLFDILQRISEIKQDIDEKLVLLERLDLIRAKSVHPALEYIFKHALTQEVVYEGLLKKERSEIHERIGLAIEQLFPNRRQEFYEILAYHFKQGNSKLKAVEYLMKAGRKSFSICSVEEAQQYYKDAYNILSQLVNESKEKNALLIDLLNDWGLTLIWRGSYTELINLFKKNEKYAASIDNPESLSMFLGSIGLAYCMREEFTESYNYLQKSLKIAEEEKNPKAIGHACFRLAHVNANLGQLDDAVHLGERARFISKDPSAELPLHRVTLSLTLAYWYRGDVKKLSELGEELLERKKIITDVRYLVSAELAFGISHLCAGQFKRAILRFKNVLGNASDPILVQAAKLLLGYAYLGGEEYQAALSISEEVMRFSEKYGFEFVGTATIAFRGFAFAATGNLHEGLQLLENAEKIWSNTNRLYPLAVLNCFYGKLYLQIVEGNNPKKISYLIKNIGPIIKLVPSAAKKSEKHFKIAIEITKNVGAKGLLAQAHMGLGLLYRATKKGELAKENLLEAIKIFDMIEAAGFLMISKFVRIHYGGCWPATNKASCQVLMRKGPQANWTTRAPFLFLAG